MKFKEFVDTHEIETLGGGKLRTKINPPDRSFKNMPKYSNGKNKVDFKKWLLIRPEKAKSSHSVASIGKSEADGKWYSWSHRAIYGFKTGDKITGDTGAKKIIKKGKTPDGSRDWDKDVLEPDFTIKDDTHAKEVAIRFADSVS
jgi:hypothetical protein